MENSNKDKKVKRRQILLLVFTLILLLVFILMPDKGFWSWFAIVFFTLFALGGVFAIFGEADGSRTKKEFEAFKKAQMSEEKQKALSEHLQDSVDVYLDRPTTEEYYVGEEIQDILEPVSAFDAGFTEFPEFYMSYQTVDGIPSNRRILLKSMTLRDDKVYLNAFCLLRNEDRMFLVDRIQSLKYQNEVIPNPAEYFKNLLENSGAFALYKFIMQKEAVFEVFLFFMKVDGSVRKEEVAIVIDYVKKYINNASDDVIEKMIRDVPVVSISNFNSILKRLKKEPADNQDIIEVYDKLYAIKKTHDPLETGVYEKVMKMLK